MNWSAWIIYKTGAARHARDLNAMARTRAQLLREIGSRKAAAERRKSAGQAARAGAGAAASDEPDFDEADNFLSKQQSQLSFGAGRWFNEEKAK